LFKASRPNVPFAAAALYFYKLIITNWFPSASGKKVLSCPNMKADPAKILFLDIETVAQKPHFDALPEEWQKLWADKTRWQRERVPESPPSARDYYRERAGVLAEFGKIVCISFGLLHQAGSSENWQLRLKSFSGHNEKKLLSDFQHLLTKLEADYLLCAHNGKEFDFPYLGRRMLIHGIALPPQLDISGLKPWQVPHLDTLELWKLGDRKNYTSLKLLAAVFGLPTPKDDIDGAQVGRVYWEEENLPRIVRYCEKDVVTLVSVYLHITGQAPEIDFQLENPV